VLRGEIRQQVHFQVVVHIMEISIHLY
jgi:hypothetical protein